MRRKIMRRRGAEFCRLEVELRDGRFSICGTAGYVLKEREARREAREFWASYFEERDTLAEFNLHNGTRFRSPERAARHVQGIDGDYSGLDVVREDDREVYVAHSCGQIREEIAQFFPEAVPYFRWHLNDMHAECAHQEARGESYHTHPHAECFDNGCARDVEDAHGRVKRVGYKIGSAWTKRELPADVVAWAQTFGVDEEAS